MCGGTDQVHRRRVPTKGLSPRVRGNPPLLSLSPSPPRSIPACAGEPIGWRRGAVGIGVYPRVCGGTILRGGHCGCLLGLSPRVRGNPCSPIFLDNKSRSIPACAGEPWHTDADCQHSGVYPRVCGGTGCTPRQISKGIGLSPRVRGNHVLYRRDAVNRGSIPACAGEPRSISLVRVEARVYPRVCGGTPVAGAVPEIGSGLSPRVRGNLNFAPCCRSISRSIPACAGEPHDAYRLR